MIHFQLSAKLETYMYMGSVCKGGKGGNLSVFVFQIILTNSTSSVIFAMVSVVDICGQFPTCFFPCATYYYTLVVV